MKPSSEFNISFESGDSIELNDINQLSTVEDMVALEVVPNMTASQFTQWKGRVAVRDLIRPPKFNGSLANIYLEVIDEPYTKLLENNENGTKFVQSKGPANIADKNLETLIESSKGLKLTADAKSTGAGTIGTIQTELFYTPIFGNGNIHSYGPVRRFVTVPTIDKDAFAQLDDESKRIGFETLRKNIMHPFIAPHR